MAASRRVRRGLSVGSCLKDGCEGGMVASRRVRRGLSVGSCLKDGSLDTNCNRKEALADVLTGCLGQK